MNIYLICSASLLFLYLGLSFYVSSLRSRRRESDSNITENDLKKVIRAHGNASEYIPLLIALFLYSDMSQSGMLIVVVSVAATISRFLHVFGMLAVENYGDRHPLRFVGAIGTYSSLLFFAVVLLFRSV